MQERTRGLTTHLPAFSLRLSPRKRNYLQSHFSLLIKGLNKKIKSLGTAPLNYQTVS